MTGRNVDGPNAEHSATCAECQAHMGAVEDLSDKMMNAMVSYATVHTEMDGTIATEQSATFIWKGRTYLARQHLSVQPAALEVIIDYTATPGN